MRYASAIIYLLAATATTVLAADAGKGHDRNAVCADAKKWPDAKIDLAAAKAKDKCISKDNKELVWYRHKDGEKTVRVKNMKETPDADNVQCIELVNREMLAKAFEEKDGLCDQLAKAVKKTKSKKKKEQLKKKAKKLVEMVQKDKKNYAFAGKKMEDLSFKVVEKSGKDAKAMEKDSNDKQMYSRLRALHNLMSKTKKDSLELTHKVDKQMKKDFKDVKVTLTSVYLNTARLATKTAKALKKDDKPVSHKKHAKSWLKKHLKHKHEKEEKEKKHDDDD